MPPGLLVYTGHRENSPAKVISIAYTDPLFEEKQGYIENFVLGKSGVLWTDVCGLTYTKLIEQIGTDHQIHPLALEDVLDTQQRSKLEEFVYWLFFIVHHLKVNCVALEIHSEQIALFARKNFLVSFQEDPDDTPPGAIVVKKASGDCEKKALIIWLMRCSTWCWTVTNPYWMILKHRHWK